MTLHNVNIARTNRVLALLLLLSSGLSPTRVSASSTTVAAATNPVVVWNAQTTGAITLSPNYNPATGLTDPSGVGNVIAASNGAFTGPTGCTPSPAQAAAVIDFADVQPPVAGKTTACDYQNALSIGVTTNDNNGWDVSEELGLAPGTGFTLCSLPNGPFVASPTAATPMGKSTVNANSATINETTCGGKGQFTLGSGNGAPSPIDDGSAPGTGTFFAGQDVLLLIAPGIYAIGSYSATLTVTLTLN